MATDIKGLGAPTPPDQTALRGTGTAKEGSATAERATQNVAVTTTPVAKAATDSISLSAQAQGLKALEEKLQKLPAINEKRVADIKAALASGKYRVDDLVVADKLLGYDELFK